MSFKEMAQIIWKDTREVKFMDGPWWTSLLFVIYVLAVGANLYSAGGAVASGRNPTLSLVFAGVILVLGILLMWLNWHSTYLHGQVKVYEQYAEHDERMLNLLRGTPVYDYDEKEPYGIKG